MIRERWLAWAPAVAIALFVGLELYAMAVYPGGTWFDRKTVGYSFSGNFFCDLTSPISLGGASNPGAPFAKAAMAILALGLAPFFWTLARVAAHGRRVILVAGSLGAIGALATPFLPSTVVGNLHGWVTVTTGALGLVAAAIGIRGAAQAKKRWIAASGVLAFVSGGVLGAIYLYAQLTHTEVPLLPLVQKVAAMLLFVWMLSPLATDRLVDDGDPREQRARLTAEA